MLMGQSLVGEAAAALRPQGDNVMITDAWGLERVFFFNLPNVYVKSSVIYRS